MSKITLGIDMAKEGSEQTVIMATRQQIADAFNQWKADYKANPEGWTDADQLGEDYGTACAGKLIEYITSGQ